MRIQTPRPVVTLVSAAVLASGLLLAGCGSGESAPAEQETTSAAAATDTQTETQTTETQTTETQTTDSGATSPAAGAGTTVMSEDEREQIPGSPDTFTGDVTIQMLAGDEETAVKPGLVQFSPGARTAWHTHPAGQRLIVTEGSGWTQVEGGERIDITEGDVVWCDPEVKHWHGATSDEAMSHIAISESVDGSDVEWMEHVTDEQYTGQES